MADYQAFIAALAVAGDQPDQAFAALQRLAEEEVGARLFSIMTFDPARRLSQRVWSSRPDAYPVSGTKPFNETYWSDIVMRDRRIFVANSIEEIAAVFPDHPLILSLGCESVINVPVVVGGEVLGTINCLDAAGHYTPERVATARMLALPGAACLLLARAQAGLA